MNLLKITPLLFTCLLFLMGCNAEDITATGGASKVVTFEKDGSTVTSITIYENTSIDDVKLVVTGGPKNAENIVFSTTSSNEDLLPNENIVITGDGKFRSLTITPTPDSTGETLLTGTVTISSNGAFTEGTLVLKVIKDPTNDITPTGRLNDTGYTLCGDHAFSEINTGYDLLGSGIHNNEINCATVNSTQTNIGLETSNGNDIVPAGQDAVYGRDVTHNDNSDGVAGFHFTKLDTNGNDLTASESNWSCVRDEVTGLVWEVKSSVAGLQYYDNTYSWYNSTGVNDGGSAGTENAGFCTGGSGCDTEKYVSDINALELCGLTGWRMPTREELYSVMLINAVNPPLDTTFFPNSKTYLYWTASPRAQGDYIWHISFTHGLSGYASRANPNFVRLVNKN